MKLNPKNKSTHHFYIVIGSIVMALLLWAAGYEAQRVIAAIPFFLLFLVLIIGPIVKIWPSTIKRFKGGFLVEWRAELGIWFTIWSVVHLLFVWGARDWDIIGYLADMSPWAFGAFIAVIIAIIMAFTSNTYALNFLGTKAWKWHQSHGAYVIFWLTSVHIYDRAYLRPYEDVGFPSPDPIHWVYLGMIAAVVALQLSAFIKIVAEYRKKGEYPPGL